MRPVRKADNLTTPCAVVMKFGNLNYLEPSGPLQACNGTDLPFLHTYKTRWEAIPFSPCHEKLALVGKLIVKIQKLFSLERTAIILSNTSFTFIHRAFFWFAWFVVLTAYVNIFSRHVRVKYTSKRSL